MFLLVLDVGGAGRRVSELGMKRKKKGLVCIYVCVSECDGPALFLGCVAQSVPSSVCPFPSHSASPSSSPPFFPFFLLLQTHKAADRKTTGRTCVCVRIESFRHIRRYVAHHVQHFVSALMRTGAQIGKMKSLSCYIVH